VSVQKLSHTWCCDEASDVPWLWTVLERCTASPPSDSDLSTVSVEAQVAAFFRLMTRLPSTAIITCQRPPTPKVRGHVQLQNAINELGRNMADVCTLPADLTLHLVQTLASLPVEVNDDLSQFLSDCPLLTLSAMLHNCFTSSAVNLTHCATAVTDVLGTISSALDEVTALLDGAARPCPSTVPAWLRGAAIWSRLYNSRYTIDASRLRSDDQTAEALLHCLTLDMAAGMLRGDDSRQVVDDPAVSVWQHHVDALNCLSDCEAQHSSVAAVFRLSVSDVLQRMQPLACLRLFVHAVDSGLERFSSQWNINRTLRWYIQCVQLFDSRQCAVTTVMTVLQHASEAICCFAANMPRSQLRSVDQTVLDVIDPHIGIVFRQLRDV